MAANPLGAHQAGSSFRRPRGRHDAGHETEWACRSSIDESRHAQASGSNVIVSARQGQIPPRRTKPASSSFAPTGSDEIARTMEKADLPSAPRIMSDRWVSVEEIAVHLGISKNTV